jgi:flagellar biosynthesis protein FliQ
MNEIDALDMLRAALWTVLVVSAPGVLAAMIIGLAIALLQALTQVQEMTLTFVPKIIAIFVAIVLTAPLMGGELQSLTNLVFARIESGF